MMQRREPFLVRALRLCRLAQRQQELHDGKTPGERGDLCPTNIPKIIRSTQLKTSGIPGLRVTIRALMPRSLRAPSSSGERALARTFTTSRWPSAAARCSAVFPATVSCDNERESASNAERLVGTLNQNGS